MARERLGNRVIACKACVAMLALALPIPGCVERTVTINSQPEGATVFLNDQEVGRTPVKVPFTWYGDYDIILRKDGYETLKTHCQLEAPWYQYPFIDLFAECLIPMTLRDEHILEPFVLAPFNAPTREGLLYRADEMRLQAREAGVAARPSEPSPEE